jgi:hypothetical protein
MSHAARVKAISILFAITTATFIAVALTSRNFQSHFYAFATTMIIYSHFNNVGYIYERFSVAASMVNKLIEVLLFLSYWQVCFIIFSATIRVITSSLQCDDHLAIIYAFAALYGIGRGARRLHSYQQQFIIYVNQLQQKDNNCNCKYSCHR